MEAPPPAKKARYEEVPTAAVSGVPRPSHLDYPKMRVAELRSELKVIFFSIFSNLFPLTRFDCLLFANLLWMARTEARPEV